MTTTSLNLDKAIGAALATIDRNLVTFADIYPHDATQDGVYPERQARRGYPPGSHTGWTTGFWAGMLWLAYELTRDDKYRRADEVQVECFSDRHERKIDVAAVLGLGTVIQPALRASGTPARRAIDALHRAI
jgi:unsaturated chondroitin disaccharide hydrolase